MSTEKLEYAAILADLEAKKAALEAAITHIRFVAGVGAAAGDTAAAASGGLGVGQIHNGEVPAGAFLGKNIPESAVLYLQIVKRKATSKEIAEALRRGGIESTSQNFSGLVHSLLTRASKTTGAEILKMDRSHWGLASWYPSGVRSAAVEQGPKSKKKKPKATKAKSKAKDIVLESKQMKPNPASEKIAPAETNGSGGHADILAILKSAPTKEWTTGEIAEKSGLGVRVAQMALGKLAKKNVVVKTADGHFHMPTAAAAVQ